MGIKKGQNVWFDKQDRNTLGQFQSIGKKAKL